MTHRFMTIGLLAGAAALGDVEVRPAAELKTAGEHCFGCYECFPEITDEAIAPTLEGDEYGWIVFGWYCPYEYFRGTCEELDGHLGCPPQLSEIIDGVEHAARNGNVGKLETLVRENRDYLVVASERNAIQVLGCDKSRVVAQVSVASRVAEQLAAHLTTN